METVTALICSGSRKFSLFKLLTSYFHNLILQGWRKLQPCSCSYSLVVVTTLLYNLQPCYSYNLERPHLCDASLPAGWHLPNTLTSFTSTLDGAAAAVALRSMTRSPGDRKCTCLIYKCGRWGSRCCPGVCVYGGVLLTLGTPDVTDPVVTAFVPLF